MLTMNAVTVRLGGRTVEGDRGAFLSGLGLRTLLHGLPELVLEALGDDGDVWLFAIGCAGPRATAARRTARGEHHGEYGRRSDRSDSLLIQ